MGMTTRAAIADALVGGGRAAGHPRGSDPGGHDGGPAGRRARRWPASAPSSSAPRPSSSSARSPRWTVHDAGQERHRPAGRPHRGGDAFGRPCRRTGGRARGGGRVGVELPLTEQVDARRRGSRVACGRGEVRDFAWVVVTSVNAADRLMAALRDARDLSGVSAGRRRSRPRRTRSAGPASSRTSFRPSTARVGWSPRSPTPLAPARGACSSPAPTWRPTPSPTASARRGGRCGASRPTAPCPDPRPSPRCWRGWPRPTRWPSPRPRRCRRSWRCGAPTGGSCAPPAHSCASGRPRPPRPMPPGWGVWTRPRCVDAQGIVAKR